MATLNGEQAELLKGKNFAVVATVGEDGVPQLTTNWIDWDGDYVVFNTAEGRYLSVTGPAEISDDGAEEHINDLSHRYFGRDYAYVEGEKRLIVRIKPERIFARGF